MTPANRDRESWACSRRFSKCTVGFGRLCFAYPAGRVLHHVVDAVRVVVGLHNGFLILNACLRLISHQRVGIGDSDLRRRKFRVDLQRHAIVDQRFVEVPGHAQQFAVGIVRIRLLGQHGHVAIHHRERFRKLPVARIDISRIIDRRGIVLVDRQRAIQKLQSLIVPVLSHQPVTSEIEQDACPWGTSPAYRSSPKCPR